MISDKHKCIFIHIPKCAGTSIENIFKVKTPSRFQHKPLSNDCFKDALQKEYFVFTFVRNPYERVLSAIFHDLRVSYVKMTPNRRRVRKIIDTHGKREGVKILLQKHLPFLIKKHINYKLQTEWIDGFEFDFIGRYENLSDDWKRICSKINFPYKPLPLINKGVIDQCNYKDFLDDESIISIYEAYKKDIDMFDYKPL